MNTHCLKVALRTTIPLFASGTPIPVILITELLEKSNIKLMIRLGVNSGPVVPMRIHVTETTKDQTVSRYQYSKNTEIDVNACGHYSGEHNDKSFFYQTFRTGLFKS